MCYDNAKIPSCSECVSGRRAMSTGLSSLNGNRFLSWKSRWNVLMYAQFKFNGFPFCTSPFTHFRFLSSFRIKLKTFFPTMTTKLKKRGRLLQIGFDFFSLIPDDFLKFYYQLIFKRVHFTLKRYFLWTWLEGNWFVSVEWVRSNV